jgi:ABC-type sugar transport system ATPase subunit
MPPVLEARNISKRFHGTQALRTVSFSLDRGEVHALMGENGAGKSTLAKVLAGVVIADDGELLVNGEKVVIDHPLRAQALGIGIVFQELDLFPHLSIAENIAIANPAAHEKVVIRKRELSTWCSTFLAKVRLDVRPNTLLRSLSIGQIQRVAIARALSMNSRVLLLDEPTSSLTEDGVQSLFELIAHLKRGGVSFVYISHKMAEVQRIADRVTVLRDGMSVGTRTATELNSEELIRMMVGRKLDRIERRDRARRSDVVLDVRSLNTALLSDINFTLRTGEVLGVAGLVGAGRSELGATLFGLRQRLSGSIQLNGHPFSPTSPAQAIKAGMCLLPEDRRWQGIFPKMSVRENASIVVLARWGSGRFQKEEKQVAEFQKKLAVSSSPDVRISSLSGGNQQKIILTRWLLAEPVVLFLDEATRGIDVAAKEQIYSIIDELASQGKGVILVSSELPELWLCCDRILVLQEGRQAGIVTTAESSQEEVLRLATGTSRRHDANRLSII